MRIAVVCNDTQGGVQPYVALGKGLKAAGHDVRLVAPANFESLVREVGLTFAPLSIVGDGISGTALAERGTLATMRAMLREMPRHIATAARETLAACEGVDLITAGIGGMITAVPVADRLGVSLIEAHLQPIGVRSHDFPGVLLSRMPRWLGRPGRHLSHRLTELALDMQFRPAIISARKAIGATGRRRQPASTLPVIYGFSRHVVPIRDSARRRKPVGYWTLPAPDSWQPSPALTSFLARPGPIISIGFGSMGSAQPDQLAHLVQNAVKRTGVRAIMLSGWAKLSVEADKDIFVANDLPHDWLFPRMSAVVHHGGAGTTGAGIRAGVPSVLVPFAVDQPFWAGRVAHLGVGPSAIPRRRLTAEKLAEAISRCLSDQMIRARATSLGDRVRSEDGVRDAVAIFNALAMPSDGRRDRA